MVFIALCVGIVNIVHFGNYSEEMMQKTSNSSTESKELFAERTISSEKINPARMKRINDTNEHFMERNLHNHKMALGNISIGDNGGRANNDAANLTHHDRFQMTESISRSKRNSMKKEVLSIAENIWSSKEFSFEGREAQAGFMAVSTAASSADMDSLRTTISEIHTKSGPVKIIIFDLGLSGADKKIIEGCSFCEIRSSPVESVACTGEVTTPCKSQMIFSLLAEYSVLIWADIGFPPSRNVRLLLDDFAVGTNFVGRLTSQALHDFVDSSLPRDSEEYGENIRLVSTQYFVIFVDLKFFSLVLSPWAKCGSDLDCALPENVKRRLKVTETKSGGLNFSGDMLLSLLLHEYSNIHTQSVIVNEALNDGWLKSSTQPTVLSTDSPSLPYIQADAKPFVSCVPLAGPNNQLTMIFKTAVIGRALSARFLAPAISPHEVPHGRGNVSTQQDLRMGLDKIFSSHFLYRHAYLASPNSSWAALLPTVDFIVFQPIEKEGRGLTVSSCQNKSSCSVSELAKVNIRIKRFFATVGILSEGNTSIRVVPCSSESTVVACFNSSLRAGRHPMGYWDPYPLIEELRCQDLHQFLLEAPFAVPRLALMDGNWHQRSCMAVQLRVWDLEYKNGMVSAYKTKSMSGPEYLLLRLNASLLLMQSPTTLIIPEWRNKTIIEIVESLRSTAAERGRELYVMMPYIRIVFNKLSRMEGVKTLMNFHFHGASDLETNFFDMALASGCANFVKHPASSITGSIRYMRGGHGILRQNLSDDRSMRLCLPVPPSPSWPLGSDSENA